MEIIRNTRRNVVNSQVHMNWNAKTPPLIRMDGTVDISRFKGRNTATIAGVEVRKRIK